MSQEAIYPTKSREDRFSAPSQDLSDPKAKRRFWEHHLAQCRQSSLTQKAYCQKQGLKLHQFYYWKKRLTPDHSNVSFFPLALPEGFSGQRPSCSVRIVAPNGFAVELQGPVNLSDLLSMAARL